MKKSTKTPLRRIIVFTCATTFIIISVMLLINPNQYKTEISKIVHKYTGRNLIIAGNMRWSLFPHLGLSLQEVALSNPPDFAGPFLKAAKINIKISCKDLLRGKITIQGFHIINPQVYLAKTATGKTNFSDLLTLKLNKAPGVKDQSIPSTRPKADSAAIFIQELSLKNANIYWQDGANNNNLLLYDFNISSTIPENIKQKLVSILVSGKVKDSTNRHKKELSFTTTVTADLETKTVVFEPMSIQFGPLEILSQATVQANNNIITLDPITIETMGSEHHLSCSMDLRTNTPIININSKTSAFEINDLLAALTQFENLHGKTNITTRLKAQGKQITQLKSSLFGSLEITMQDGDYCGIDLHALRDHIQNSLHTLVDSLKIKDIIKIPSILGQIQDWKVTANANAKTNFAILRLTAQFKDGISQDTKFLIEHSDYIIQGNGEINLVTDTINMKIQALYKTVESEQDQHVANYILNTPLNISIQGSLSQPTITPDLLNYCKEAIIKLQKGGWKNLLKNALDKITR